MMVRRIVNDEDMDENCTPGVKEQVRFSHKRCMWSTDVPKEQAPVARALWPTHSGLLEG